MDAEITVEWSKAVIRRATMRFWVRGLGWRFILCLSFLLALLVVLLCEGYRGWCAYLIGGLAGLLVIQMVVGYFAIYKRALANFNLMEDPKTTFRFNEDGVSLRSDVGSSETKWRAFGKVWRFPEIWLLFHGEDSYVLVPAESLSPDLKEFIVRKVEENGGKVS